MKHLPHLRTLVWLLLMFALLLFSCGKTDDSSDTTTQPTDTEQTTTTTPEAKLTLVDNGTSEYVIYRSKNLGDLTLAAVTKLTNTIRAETGATLKIVTDWGDAGEKDTENTFAILIGNTSFPQSERLKQLKLTQYLIEMDGNKLIIGGRDDAATAEALDAFLQEFVVGKGKTITFGEKQNVFHAGKYPKETYLRCAGEPIEHYRIVIPAKADIAVTRCASQIAAHLAKLTGIVYEVLTDDVATDHGAYEILIGKTTRTTITPERYSYEISVSGKTMQICADSWYAYEEALNVFFSDIVYLRKPVDIADGARYSKHLEADLEKASPSLLNRNSEVRIMYHNIWGNTSGGAMHQRMLQLAALYQNYNPDVIALQECSPAARSGSSGNMVSILSDLGYTEVPAKATNDLKNNYTPLFYRPDTVKLIDYGYRLYQGQNDSGSKGATWAVFETISTGETFGALSTHYWWQNDDPSDNATRESNAREMLELIRHMQDVYHCPVLSGGDFNCNASSNPYSILLGNGLRDTQSMAAQTINRSTHHTYPVYDENMNIWDDPVYPGHDYSRAIDHVFTTQDNITVKQFDVVIDLYALLSSDHCPLIVDFDLNEKEKETTP